MPRPARLLLIAAAVLLVSGCALRDPRDSYAYGRVADGLWDADYDLLLDWNFPTSANQGRLEAPKRFRPERTAIGVPWATGNPMQPREPGQAPALDIEPLPAPAVAADEDDAGAEDDEAQIMAPGADRGDRPAASRIRE